MFRRGDISWFLHPEQQKLLSWLEERRREIAVVCISRQFGKSTMMLAYCMAYCVTHPKSTVLFIAPHRTQLDNYMLPKLNMVFQFLPDDLVPVKRDTNWTFPNGSIFRLAGIAVGKGARIRGDAVHLCVMDECRDMADMQTMIESHIGPMFTTTNGNLVLISTPPESPLHTFTDKYIREAIATDDFYTATYKENPLLSTKRIRYLVNVLHKGGENNHVFRREYMADYTIADPEKRVIREWNEEDNDRFFENYAGPRHPVRIYTGMDYAHSDPCGILTGYFDTHEGCLIIEDEHFERGMQTDDVALKIIDMEARLKARLPTAMEEKIRIMDIDPSLMGDLSTRYQLRFEPAFKVPSMLTMLNRLRIAILEGKIRIRPQCANLRFQLRSGVFNEKGTDYIRTARGGHLDLLDALKYLNLNCRWQEVLAAPPQPGLRHNQIYVGPFANPHSFREGVMNRPR